MLLLIMLTGCESAPPEHDLDDPVTYTELTLTKLSTEPEIVAEVARLEAAGQLVSEASPIGLAGYEAGSYTLDPPFAQQFPADVAQAIYKSTVLIYPQGHFTWKPRQLAEATKLRQTHDRYLARIRRYMQQHDLAFGLDLREGLLADTSFVEVVRAGHRLEALEAAVLLDRGQLDPAIDRLAAMLLMAAKLDDLPHVVSRLAAAELREEASHVLEAIANHAEADTRIRLRLSNIIEAQLVAWPVDKLAWMGDRAVALHAYEMVRAGQLPSLLTEAEMDALEERGKLTQIAAEVTRQVDHDQAFYLDSIGKLIAACDQPYAQRVEVIARIERKLDALSNTPKYPYVAGDMLLAGIRPGNHRQVSDLALWRAFGELLNDQPSDSGAVNPLTNQAYSIEVAGDMRAVEIELVPGRMRKLTIKQ